MAKNIQQLRGLEKDLPRLAVGQLAFTTDTKKMFVGSKEGNVEFVNKEGIEKEISDLSDSQVTLENEVTAQLAQVAIGNIEQSTRLQAYEHARIIDNKQSFRQGIVTISNNSQSVGGWFKSAASFATVAFGGSGQVDTNYTIALDVVSGDKSAIGDLRVHDRTLNGFKIGYSGSAKNATIAWALINKEGAKL